MYLSLIRTEAASRYRYSFSYFSLKLSCSSFFGPTYFQEIISLFLLRVIFFPANLHHIFSSIWFIPNFPLSNLSHIFSSVVWRSSKNDPSTSPQCLWIGLRSHFIHIHYYRQNISHRKFNWGSILFRTQDRFLCMVVCFLTASKPALSAILENYKPDEFYGYRELLHKNQLFFHSCAYLLQWQNTPWEAAESPPSLFPF